MSLGDDSFVIANGPATAADADGPHVYAKQIVVLTWQDTLGSAGMSARWEIGWIDATGDERHVYLRALASHFFPMPLTSAQTHS